MMKFLHVFVSHSYMHLKQHSNKIFIGVACIDPPVPPESTNLVVIYEPETVIEFGETVTYKCLPGFHFEENYFMKDFTLTCQTNGNFTDPVPWKRCLHPTSKIHI